MRLNQNYFVIEPNLVAPTFNSSRPAVLEPVPSAFEDPSSSRYFPFVASSEYSAVMATAVVLSSLLLTPPRGSTAEILCNRLACQEKKTFRLDETSIERSAQLDSLQQCFSVSDSF